MKCHLTKCLLYYKFDELEFDELGFDELGFNELRLYLSYINSPTVLYDPQVMSNW
jgi:hypothetical protein